MGREGNDFMKIKADGTVVFRDRKRLRRFAEASELAGWWMAATHYHLDPRDFASAFHYVNLHPIFWRIQPPADMAATWADELSDSEAARLSRGSRLDRRSGVAQVEVTVVKVDPKTNSISDDEALNTATRVWLEAGPYLWPTDYDTESRRYMPAVGMPSHDHRLDVGAATFEQAIVKLARKLSKHYGDDRSQVAL